MIDTSLITQTTLHVRVPSEIDTYDFEQLIEDLDLCNTRGYDGLDNEDGGLLIDASDVASILESDPEDAQIAAFFREVAEALRIDGREQLKADKVYFHR